MMVEGRRKPIFGGSAFCGLLGHGIDEQITIAKLRTSKITLTAQQFGLCWKLGEPGSVFIQDSFTTHNDPIFTGRISKAGAEVEMFPFTFFKQAVLDCVIAK
jgi:hypothetical protein